MRFGVNSDVGEHVIYGSRGEKKKKRMTNRIFESFSSLIDTALIPVSLLGKC